MTVEEIRAKYPLEDFLAKDGIKLVGSGRERSTNRCAYMEHKPGHLCVNVNVEKQLWHCNDCGKGGSIIDWFAGITGMSPSEAIRKLGGDDSNGKPKSAPAKEQIEAVYQYQDAFGQPSFEVVRLKPKTFRQRHSVNGKWVWDMQGVERALYHLPEVLKADTVWLTEGEKDADNLIALGYCATTNVGGAKKWMDGYTDTLAGKKVVICGDTDQAGLEHVKKVFDSIAGHVPELRIVKVPPPHKDASDWIKAGATKADFDQLFQNAPVFTKGIQLEIYPMWELEERYSQYATSLDQNTFELGCWLPSIGKHMRRFVPGELIMFLGATGVGKTAILSNVALHTLAIPTLFFQLELADMMMFERLVAIRTGIGTQNIERGYRSGQREGGTFFRTQFPKLFISTKARLTVEQIEKTINAAELKMGERPKLVLVDYVQLVQGHGESRYDRFSSVAEDLKVMSKTTGTIVVCSSQIHRKADDDHEVHLCDAKESGSIENSSGVVIGAWRPDEQTIMLRVLKNKGPVGALIECNYDNRTLRITERTNASPTGA